MSVLYVVLTIGTLFLATFTVIFFLGSLFCVAKLGREMTRAFRRQTASAPAELAVAPAPRTRRSERTAERDTGPHHGAPFAHA